MFCADLCFGIAYSFGGPRVIGAFHVDGAFPFSLGVGLFMSLPGYWKCTEYMHFLFWTLCSILMKY